MFTELLKFAFSSLRGRVGDLFKLLRKGWDTISHFFHHGIGSWLAPDLEPEERAAIRRLRARAEVVLQERAEKQARDHAKTELGRAEADASREAAEKASTAMKEAVSAAADSAVAGQGSAAVVKAEERPAVVATIPKFGANATIRTAAVFKAVAPVAVRALVRALGDLRIPREEEPEPEAV